jgi:hypothetical protein
MLAAVEVGLIQHQEPQVQVVVLVQLVVVQLVLLTQAAVQAAVGELAAIQVAQELLLLDTR